MTDGKLPVPRPDSPNPPHFALIAESVRTGCFLGVPSFRPSVASAALFNPWAYLFGPLFFFVCGLWRKGLVLSCVGIVCYLPLLFGTDNALARILLEEYAIPHLALIALGQLFVVLCCMGQHFYAALTAILFTALFLGSEPYVRSLDLGFCTALVWLNAPLVWQAMGRVALFFLLDRHWTAALVPCAAGVCFWFLGLPRLTEYAALPALAYPVFCGMMATWDLYRKRILHQTFWW